MGFWSDAFDSLGDNLEIVAAVQEDVRANLNPFGESFLSGDAPNTAKVAEEQNAARDGREPDPVRIALSSEGGLSTIGDATVSTGREVKDVSLDAIDKAGKVAGTALDVVTSKYGLAAIAVVVVLVLVAPYAAPYVAKAAA